MNYILNRRSFCNTLVSALPATFGASGLQGASRGESLVYFGTYTRSKSKGIYVSRFSTSDGKLTPPELAGEMDNPSSVALHPSGKFLYAVAEVDTYQGQQSGFVAGFSIDRTSGNLTPINQAATRGGGPCHLAVDETGMNVLVANYGGGSVACFPVKPDGSLSAASAFDQHTGSGPNRSRQAGPHAHQVVLSPDNRFAFVPDLGLDSVFIYRFDAANGTLTANDPPVAKLAPGAGPRHFAFRPKGKFAYVICELTSMIAEFSYNAKIGALKELQTVSTLPKDFKGTSSTAEIAVHPNGRFLYGSNRGHDSIAVFAVDSSKGALTLVDHVPTQGKNPRSFAIDPSGRFLLAANQDTDDVAGFRVDQKTGRLTPTGQTIEVGAPVAIVYLA